jgi:colanic acid/amylovoran biosynthesis glycosyltransferase
MTDTASSNPVTLQRCDQFVGRTMNWLYDHLRFVPRYIPVVLCDTLANRNEFPELKAWSLNYGSLTRRLWRRIARNRLYPGDSWRLGWLAPCVLHSHFGYKAVQDHELRRVLDVPWIASFYGADVYELGRLAEWQQMYARVFDEACRVLALGPNMAAYLEQLGCPREKIVIHPLGVDVSGLPSKPRELRPGEPLRLLFAGTFREKKGIAYVIEAAALARRTGVRLELHLVGDAAGKPGDRETKDAVFRQIRSLCLDDIVTHHSFLRFMELVNLALLSHVFIAPSVTAKDGDAEGTPFVLQQMMATGMPAIATSHSDIPYIFGEHAHLLVPERDSDAIADCLRHYADDPAALFIDGTKLRDRVQHAFDVRKCAARLASVYDAIRGLPMAERSDFPVVASDQITGEPTIPIGR